MNGIPLKAMAAGEDNSVPISASVVLPENQFNKDASYFYLKMTPGQEQKLEVKLNNSSDKAQTVKVNLAPGITNDNGIIDYPDTIKEYDKTLKNPFSKIASTDKKVTIDANSGKSIFVDVKMPTEEYDGMIIGGINIILADDEEEKDEKEKSEGGGMQIRNIIRYNFGVVLIENENIVTPDMKMNKAYAGQVMGVNTFMANLSNTESWIIDNLEVTAKVYKKGSNEVLYEANKKGLRMAPNSNFNFGISMGTKAYQPGDYRMTVVAKSESPDKEWSFEKNFTIDRETAKKLNEKAAELDKDYTMYWIIGGASLIALLIIVIVLIVIYRKKKKAKEEAERKRRLARKRKRQAQAKKAQNAKSTKEAPTRKRAPNNK